MSTHETLQFSEHCRAVAITDHKPDRIDELAALAQAVRELERAASVLRRQMHDHQSKLARKRDARDRIESFKKAGRAALRLERDGIELGTAALRVSQAQGIPVETVALWQERARRGGTAQERAARNREVLRLAARGWTNAKLARRFGLSERTITRIVSGQFRP